MSIKVKNCICIKTKHIDIAGEKTKLKPIMGYLLRAQLGVGSPAVLSDQMTLVGAVTQEHQLSPNPTGVQRQYLHRHDTWG